MNTATQNKQLAVMFADISESTSLYGKFGDQAARRMVSECLNIMIGVVNKFHGNVVKTIGDEVFCTFETVEAGFSAACEMQTAVEELKPGGHANMHIRIGLHYGPVLVENNDVHGDTVNTAARLTAITRARQILTSREVATALSAQHAMYVRQIMRREFRGKVEVVDVFQVQWEQEDTTTTRIGMSRFRKPSEIRNELILRYGNQVVTLSEVFKSAELGRHETCDIVVKNTLASRHHARVDLRFGKLVIADHSANGTYVRFSDGQVVPVSHDEIALHGAGTISLGCSYLENPTDLIEFIVQ